MKTVKASEFKAKCLQIMDDIAETGDTIVVTKNGKPVARMVPYQIKPDTLYGMHKDKIVVEGDIISPIDVVWNADQ